MKTFFTKIIITVTLISLLMGCAPAVAATPTPAPVEEATAAPVEPTAAPTPETVHLKVSILPFLSYAPLFIAQEEGFFAAQNLEVEFVNLQTSQENTTALYAGQIDVGIGFINVGLMNAIGQGETIQIVASKGFLDPAGCTGAALLARKAIVTDGELNLSPSDIKNVKASYSKSTIAEYFYDSMMSPFGAGSSDIEDIFLPYNQLPEAIKTGNMDLVMMAEPWVSRILNTGEAVTLRDYKNDFPNAEFSVMMFGPTLLKDNPEAGKRFMVAYLQGLKQYLEGKTERNIAIANQYTQLDPAELQSLCWQPIRADGAINTQTIVDFQNWAVTKGYLEKAVSVDEFWNPIYIEFAQEQLK